MKQIHEPARTIPVMAATELLVVGSGPGGLSAALAAAREGVDTMLVERFGCFGGNITQAMVESIAWYRHEHTVEAGGIGLEFERRAEQIAGRQPEPQSLSQALDADYFKVVADELVREAHIVPVLHCFAVRALMEGDTITGIVTESKSGRQAILAKRVIDATGDADIAHLAGAPYRMLPADERMGVSVSFGCQGVDAQRFRAYVREHPSCLGDWDELEENTGKENRLFSPYLEEPFNKAKAAGEISEDLWIKGTWSSVHDSGDATYMNMVVIDGIDPTNVNDLTRAEMEGRRQVMLAIAALKKYTPGFEKARLRTFCSSLGVRESRKIVSASGLTEADVRNQGRCDDAIGIFPEFLDAYGVVIIPTTGRYFQVPFGILVPQGVENLLVAGRCVGGDKISHAATRQMMCCTVTGQGAGVAAAVSVRDGVAVGSVDIGRVQKALERQGVRIE